MTKSSLDWTNAFIGSMDAAPHVARAGELASRLADEVSKGLLPYLSMPYMDGLLKELAGFKSYFAKFEHMLVLGIGGSALGARALQKAFFPQQDQPCHEGPWLWIADNVDVYAMEAFFSKLPPEKTVVVVISKSGGTIETIGGYFLAREWLEKHLGAKWGEHLFLVTDEQKGFLRDEANRLGAKSLPVPDNLGGRYSALSAVGLVPALFMGMDWQGLVQGARDMAAPLTKPGLDAAALAAHPAFDLAVWNMALMDAGYDQLIFFSYIPQWACYGDWFCQLWAESLGKNGKGSQPLASTGVTDQHSVNQMYLDGPRNKACFFLTCETLPMGGNFPSEIPDNFSYIKGKPFGELIQAEGIGTRMALVKTGVPLVRADMGADTAYQAGQLMILLETATILTGWLMGVNPIDQPAVELGKRLAKARLGADGLAEEKADLKEFLTGKRTIKEF